MVNHKQYNNMNSYKKQNYLSPWAEVFSIHQESAFLGSVTVQELPNEEEYDFDA